MRTIPRHNLLVMLLCILLSLSACGQKGDLYLPEGDSHSAQAG
jgi:predicted small lipoprotein YifL